VIGDQYRISRLLGKGGMARVSDAFDDRLERRVAVKVLRPETEALPGMRTRFQQEARIAARLIHPRVCLVMTEALAALAALSSPGRAGRHRPSSPYLSPRCSSRAAASRRGSIRRS
jgi:serine/threonine protein kinase